MSSITHSAFTTCYMDNPFNKWVYLFMDKGMGSVASDAWLHTVTHSFWFMGKLKNDNPYGSISKSSLLTVA